jgi:hypothetical protein
MLKTFIMPHIAPITETFDLERSKSAVQNLIRFGGYELLSRFVAVVDMGSSSSLPQSADNYYFVFGDVINGQALIIADALKFWTKELKDQNQEATIQNIINSLEKREKTNSKTPTLGTVLYNFGKQDIVSVGKCVIKKA